MLSERFYDKDTNSEWFNFKFQPPLTETRNNSSDNHENKNDLTMIAIEIVKFSISMAVTYYLTSKIINIIKNVLENPEDNIKHIENKKQLAKRLNRPEIEAMSFTSHELIVLNSVLSSDEINVSFTDIGGMDVELEEVKDNIVLPIKIWNRFKSYQGFSSCPSGVLLYGKPGTGKSLTAKAIAKGQYNMYYMALHI